MKSAFEQVYGAPYLARMLFAEVGECPEEDLFLRVEYDGEIATNGAVYGQLRHGFAVLSGTAESRELMEQFLKAQHAADASFGATVKSALDAWSIGHMSLQAGEAIELPDRAAVLQHRQEQLANSGIEAAVLEREATRAIRYRSLPDTELRKLSNE
jgi:proteasome alpha subunit